MTVMPYPLLAPVSKYGYFGVQLFFMISGFVILMSAANGSLRDFMISRFVRICPAFWACCTITFIVTLLIGAPRFTASISQYLANMTMLHGFVGFRSMDGVYWSLFVEFRFYTLIALILLIGKIQYAQTFIVMWLAASVGLEIYPVGKLRYLLIADYSEYFIAGATFFLIWSQGFTRTRAVILAVAWCLAVYKNMNSLQEFEEQFHTRIDSAVGTGLISLFFAVMLLIALRRTGAIGRGNWMLAGVLTYPIYLLHQNIGFMVFNLGYQKMNVHVLFWSVVFASLFCAYMIHVHVEKRLSSRIKNALIRITDGMPSRTLLMRRAAVRSVGADRH
jgi:peptidoglycan/LPS O-acetylase OafA/YrhL